jgi:hypothetical protein
VVQVVSILTNQVDAFLIMLTNGPFFTATMMCVIFYRLLVFGKEESNYIKYGKDEGVLRFSGSFYPVFAF